MNGATLSTLAKVQTHYRVPTSINGVFLIERPTFADQRGFFREIERRTDLTEAVKRHISHAQWNHSRSRKGVLRGIHVARWNKCVYVVRGNAQLVVIDVRVGSETFGRHESFVIGEKRRAMVFVPAGCGNSVLALSGWVDLMYSVDEEWSLGGEFGIAWDDSDLAIRWKIRRPLLSDKDQHNPTVREVFPNQFLP
jgi:dTDP-4-dehydrorhamnose 3,5-epimerase